MDQSKMIQVFVDEQSRQALEGIQNHFQTVLSPINHLQDTLEEMSGQIEVLQESLQKLQRCNETKLDDICSEVKRNSEALMDLTDVMQRIDRRTATQEVALRQLKDALLALNWEI